MLCPCKWFTEMAKWLTCVHYPYDSCLLYVVELVWLDPVKEGEQMTHLLSSSDVIYTRVIKRAGRTGLVHPGCLLLRILLPCRIMTLAMQGYAKVSLIVTLRADEYCGVGLFGKLFPHDNKLLCVSEWFCILCHLSDGGVFQEWKDVHHLMILCKFPGLSLEVHQ